MFSIDRERIKISCEELNSTGRKFSELISEMDSCIAAVSQMKGMGEPERFLKKCREEMEEGQREIKEQGTLLERVLYCYGRCEDRVQENAESGRIRYKAFRVRATSAPEISDRAAAVINSITL